MPIADPNLPLLKGRESFWCYFSGLGIFIGASLDIFLPTHLSIGYRDAHLRLLGFGDTSLCFSVIHHAQGRIKTQ